MSCCINCNEYIAYNRMTTAMYKITHVNGPLKVNLMKVPAQYVIFINSWIISLPFFSFVSCFFRGLGKPLLLPAFKVLLAVWCILGFLCSHFLVVWFETELKPASNSETLLEQSFPTFWVMSTGWKCYSILKTFVQQTLRYQWYILAGG